MPFTLPRIRCPGTRLRPRKASCPWVSASVLLLVAMMTGCATTPVESVPETTAVRPIDSTDAARAAAFYADLTADNDAVRESSARALIERGLLAELSAYERFEVYAVALTIAVARGDDRDRTEPLFDAISPVTDAQRDRLHNIQADHAAAHGEHFDAFLHLVHARSLADDERNRRIWAHLLTIPDRLISTPRNANPLFDRTARAWWELAERYARATSPRDQHRIWTSWQELNAGHQAVRGALDLSQDLNASLRIAVLLPLDGEMVSAGEAIRNGFVAAQIEDGQSEDEILLFDTSGGIETAIDAAIEAEIDVIVGPLLKEDVSAVAARDLDVPVVALNQINESHDNIIQLALASEDDARVIARAVRERGYERVVLIAIPQAWSQRAFLALQEALGETVVETVTIDSSRNVTELTAGLFDIDEGQERHSVITGLVGSDVEYTAIRRQDVDAVIALVGSVRLVGLLPALSFHAATDLPLLLPSNVLRATPNSRAVESMQVAVPTWQLFPNRLERESIRRVASTIQSPLVALGIDAYRVAKRIDAFRANEPIIGSTGVLRFAEGAVERDLHWAEYERGRLRHRPARSSSEFADR